MKLATDYYDHVASVDFETFWDAGYTLSSKSQSMTEYVRDPRFEAQTCAITIDGGETVAAVGRDIPELLRSVDWDSTAMLGHHTQFDGLIATHHYDTYPVFWLDTMSISKAVYGADVAHSFHALSARLGLAGKTKQDSIVDTKGKYLRDMTDEEIGYIVEYNKDDSRDTYAIFEKIHDYLPFEELRIIDATIRMYCEPVLELDEARLRGLHGREAERRARLVEDADTTTVILGSAPKFADLLRSLGVVPPMKISRKTKLPTYAFAKTDLEFKALLLHPDEAVRKAVEARLSNKGSIVEKRSARLIKRVGLPTPVYLSYAAARTLRWGGGDLSNWQNLPSTGDGANLRKAILAPRGTKIIGSDASQVEPRMAAWLSNFDSKLEAFRAYDAGVGPDIYCVSAEGAFGRPIDKIRDPFERFIGKVLELSCQYGAGAVRVRNTLLQGFRGADPVDVPLAEMKQKIRAWRMSGNKPIIDEWDALENCMARSWYQGEEVEHGPLVFEKLRNDGYVHLPNGTFLKYRNVHWSESERSLAYMSKNGPTKLWGGYMLENVTQALCCALLKHQMLQMIDEMPWLRLVLLVHDEVVSLAENDKVEEYAERIKQIMSTPAPWCADLPLNAATNYGEYYDKA